MVQNRAIQSVNTVERISGKQQKCVKEREKNDMQGMSSAYLSRKYI